MSRTNFDFLFQVAAPVADRALTAPGRIGDPQPAFGHHLNQASAIIPEPIKTIPRDTVDRYRPPANEPAKSPVTTNDAAPTAGAAREKDEKHESDSQKDPNAAPDIAAGISDGPKVAEPPDDNSDDTQELNNECPCAFAGPAEVVSDGAASQIVAASAIEVDPAAEIANTAGPSGDNSVENTAGDSSNGLPPRTNTEAVRSAAIAATDDTIASSLLESDSGLDQQSHIEEETSAMPKATKQRIAEQNPHTGEISEQRESQQTGQHSGTMAANDEASASVVATTGVNANSESDDATTADQPTDGLDAPDKKPDRHSSARSTSKSVARAEAAAVAGKIATVAFPNNIAQSSDTTTNSETTKEATPVVKSDAPKAESLATAGRLHAGNSADIRGGRANEPDNMPRIDAARFVGRVAKAFQTAQERGGTLQLRLSPPELGPLRLELMVKEGVMTAALETETSAARRVLLDHLPALRDRLAEQNIRIERFDVDVRRDGGGQADDRAPQWQQHQQQSEQPASRRQSIARPQVAEAVPNDGLLIESPINSTGINIFA